MPTFSAILLAAGRSSRMGRDKALLQIDGVPFWQHQRAVLADAGAAEIFLSARPDQAWAGTALAAGFAAVLSDPQPDCGPMAGITAGIERATHSHLAVLAIDLPRITTDWFVKLLNACAPGVGAVARREGFFEPLAAIYPREAMPLFWEALAKAEYSLQRLLMAAVAQRLMAAHEITAGEAPQFENWNETEKN